METPNRKCSLLSVLSKTQIPNRRSMEKKTQIPAIELLSPLRSVEDHQHWYHELQGLNFHSRPDRIVPIAERFGMDPRAVLNNYNLLLGLAAKMSEEPFRLLIMDSVIALFRVNFTGRGELADRQQKPALMLSRLIKIAEEFNVAVYMTNQVIADPGGGVFISDPKKPAGGHVLAHAAIIRLMFRKGNGEQRVYKVFDAPNLPEAEAVLQGWDSFGLPSTGSSRKEDCNYNFWML